MKSYLYVLNYNRSEIYEIELENQDDDLNIDEIFKKYGINEDECSWMFVDGHKLELETLKPIE